MRVGNLPRRGGDQRIRQQKQPTGERHQLRPRMRGEAVEGQHHQRVLEHVVVKCAECLGEEEWDECAPRQRASHGAVSGAPACPRR